MYAVDSYAAVRRFVFVEGKSRREAARFRVDGPIAMLSNQMLGFA